MTLGGFFAFQVADASAVSTRSRGKDALAVRIGVTLRGGGRGLLVSDPNERYFRFLSQKQAMCVGGRA